MLTRIIMVNVTVFLVILLASIFVKGFAGQGGYNTFLQFFMMSDDWLHNLTHPWVFFSYMFLHESFWHLFWNMVVLYWFGNIVGDFLGDRVVLPTYLLSGLAGAFIYFFVANLPIPWMIGGYMLGASAAVNGFMMLAASKFPDYEVRLILLGPVRIKYVVAVFIIIDLIAISENSNTGGHLAHIGGAAMGWFIVYLWDNQNVDLIGRTNGILDNIANFFKGLVGEKSKQGSTVRVDYQPPQSKPKKQRSARSQKSTPPPTQSGQSHQDKLDGILDKIKVSGYENLTAEEKDFLYNASKKD
ncbi:MAG: membrane associated rhomboid family serine protease [Saprospiraceae bacterium]|jgi:membrane associated rhomboid family serine protease